MNDKYNLYTGGEKMDKRILVLVIIIVILVAAIGLLVASQQNNVKHVANNTTVNNTTVKNATLENETTTSDSSSSESGQYGYCAICGKALTYSEAHHEYTQGKVCSNCAKNPYYQTEEGSRYANQKLAEAYPDEYEWMNDDTSSDYEYYEDYEDYGDYDSSMDVETTTG